MRRHIGLVSAIAAETRAPNQDGTLKGTQRPTRPRAADPQGDGMSETNQTPDHATERVDWPDHEPDAGRTGNPVNWCERCRLEAQSLAAPQRVKLGEWVVTYDGTYFCAECKGEKMARSTVITLCHNLGIIPTADEYAALLRLADKGDGNA